MEIKVSFSAVSGGKIVSSKPFASLNFRINSRNLSGKSYIQSHFAPSLQLRSFHIPFVCVCVFFLCRYRHNHARCWTVSAARLSVLDREASFLLSAYNRPYHSECCYYDTFRRTLFNVLSSNLYLVFAYCNLQLEQNFFVRSVLSLIFFHLSVHSLKTIFLVLKILNSG